MKDISVLLTGCGAPGAPGIIKCLRKNGERRIRIVGVDMNAEAASRGLVDAFYTVPAASDERFIAAILEICERETINVVEPIVTRELKKFAAAKHCFHESGISVLVADEMVLDVINNKANLLAAMRERGLPTPDFVVVNSIEELILACEHLGYPEKAICVKAAVGNGSRGVRIIDSKKSRYELFFNEKPNSMYISYEEMINTLSERKHLPEMLVMEYLPGEEYGVDVICDHGNMIVSVGRCNFSVNSSIPQGCVLENRDEPIEIARKICETFQIDGHANFDFKYDALGEARLMEINPRLSATIVAYAAAGLNLPYLGIKRALGEEFVVPDIHFGLRMVRRNSEFFYDEKGKPVNW